MRAVLRGRSGGNTSGTRTRTRPRAGKSNARLCDDHPKRSRSDPGERGEKHRSRQAYGVDRKTIAKWKARKFSSDVQMGPKNPRSKFLTLDDEVIILAYRSRTRLSLDDSLVRLRRLMPQLSRSALYRCLERNGLSKIGRTNVSPPLTSARAAVVITSADELPSLMGLAFDVGF